jgi:hypothetical protein
MMDFRVGLKLSGRSQCKSKDGTEEERIEVQIGQINGNQYDAMRREI